MGGAVPVALPRWGYSPQRVEGCRALPQGDPWGPIGLLAVTPPRQHGVHHVAEGRAMLRAVHAVHGIPAAPAGG
eukprot:14914442-Alexandrium_andersonii.AAC.1